MSFASAVVKEWYASVMATASLPAILVVGGAAGGDRGDGSGDVGEAGNNRLVG